MGEATGGHEKRRTGHAMTSLGLELHPQVGEAVKRDATRPALPSEDIWKMNCTVSKVSLEDTVTEQKI